MLSPIFQVIVVVFAFNKKVEGSSCTHDGLTATLRWQEITSPRFPHKFPPQTQCSWRIEAPQNFRVKIQFSSFSLLPPNDNKCAWQGLSIMNGDKDAENPANFFTLCGQDNPGTLISNSQVLRLNLNSNSRAGLGDYMGFQASYSMTDEDPVMRPTASDSDPLASNLPAPSYDSDPDHESIASVIKRLKQNSGVKYGNTVSEGISQSERAEAINRRRNMGLPVNDNPRYDENGNPIRKQQQQQPKIKKRNLTDFSYNSKKYDDADIPYKKPKRSSLSPQIKTVLIVIGLIALFFLIILLCNKLGFFKYLSKVKERRTAKQQKQAEAIPTVAGNAVKLQLESEVNSKKANRRKKTPPSRKRGSNDVTHGTKQEEVPNSTERRRRRKKKEGAENVTKRTENVTKRTENVTKRTENVTKRDRNNSSPKTPVNESSLNQDENSKRRRRRKRRTEQSSSSKDQTDVIKGRHNRSREERSRRSRKTNNAVTSSSNDDSPPKYEKLSRRRR